MHNVDISGLVKQALLLSGCPQQKIGSLDEHSTIALDFHWSPTIYIASRDDDLWLWCRLGEHPDKRLDASAAALLRELMVKLPFVRGDQLSVSEEDGQLELRGIVAADYLLEPARFSEALEGFLASADKFNEILK